jgi:hypothetical protein
MAGCLDYLHPSAMLSSLILIPDRLLSYVDLPPEEPAQVPSFFISVMFHLCIPRITFITTIFLRPLRLICLHNFDVLTLLSSVIMDSSSASLAEIIPGSHPELPSFSTDLFYITFDPFLDQWRSQDASGTIVHLSEEELFGNLKVFHHLRLYHCSSVSHTR